MYLHYGHAMLGREYVDIKYVECLECGPNGKALQLISSLNTKSQIDK